MREKKADDRLLNHVLATTVVLAPTIMPRRSRLRIRHPLLRHDAMTVMRWHHTVTLRHRLPLRRHVHASGPIPVSYTHLTLPTILLV